MSVVRTDSRVTKSILRDTDMQKLQHCSAKDGDMTGDAPNA
eukprot:CAMPEP_0169421824 /NCGR_PEP_ID=MMETSP1017-20121227/66525_1 /TAXON_ID=342587 /ORGANISM="Karlodinium micrum, Strain CCMP2283" /LENGTH=40 /DNA_ID= /DNA_START= /DNA_END= /DNA_ORIENTATION=